ncbi:MAG: PA14 domain-containing protein, partial [Chloroflexota bacterium]|nr:PA14 domain-containing protein [Chloroflexota bacterium]
WLTTNITNSNTQYGPIKPDYSPNGAQMVAWYDTGLHIANMSPIPLIFTRINLTNYNTNNPDWHISNPPPQLAPGTGLLGTYYNGITLSAPVGNRLDPVVDFNFAANPSLITTVGVPQSNLHNFSARWRGFVTVPVTGNYRFYAGGDDGVRLFINGTYVLNPNDNPWSIHGYIEFPSLNTINMTAGQLYPIEMQYYSGASSQAQATLKWTLPGQTARVIIPQQYLYPLQSCPTGILSGTPEVCQPVATFTPMPPQSGWYVGCAVQNDQGRPVANVRNFPSLEGQVIFEYNRGTIVTPLEYRRDRDGREWVRISHYEAVQQQTLWIATSNLVQFSAGQTPACATSTPPSGSSTPQPTATVTRLPATINCLPNHYCPHAVTYNAAPNTPDHMVLGFVLACEADNNFFDAINIAWVFRNRTVSAQFRGSIWDVMRQSGQWDCFVHGARPNSILVSVNGGVINSNILTLASYMITGRWDLILPPSDMRIRWYGLFTYGTGPFNSPSGNDNVPIIDLLNSTSNNIIASGQCPHSLAVLSDIFIARSSFGTSPVRSFTTLFFTDSPITQCVP